MVMDSKNIAWINNAKALCMIAVYYIHSQVYYGYGPVGDFLAYSMLPFYVNLFFFVSGFLFLTKRAAVDKIVAGGVQTRKSLASVLYKLAIPTVLFATLIYIPKLMFHSREISFGQYLYDVFGGVSFWFTSALTIVQLIFIFLTSVGVRNSWWLMFIGLLFFVSGNFLETVSSGPFPWHYKSAMCASFFFAAGGLFGKYSGHWRKLGIWRNILIPLYALLMLLTYDHRSSLMFGSMGVGYNVAGTLICIFAIVVVQLISEIIGRNRILEYIGRRSIVFYFFSGVMPALWGTLMLKLIPTPGDMSLFLVTIISLVASASLTWFIERFLPFLTDLRKLSSKK